jgi:uncharacterized protein (DUF58 family)
VLIRVSEIRVIRVLVFFMNDPQRYLDPLILAKVGSLELQARLIVEGYLSGMHKSPYHGFSVEFAQHREYVPGDDIKHVDWKVYGRTGRFFLKQYEEETNLALWLVVDSSESMRYTSGAVSKFDYACMAAAGLAFLTLQQQDSVGLATFDNQLRTVLRPSSQASHLKEIVALLSQTPNRDKTHMAPIFHDLAERLTRRSIVVLLSDLFDEPGEILHGLRHLNYKRHEVVVLHVMDSAELEFPFQEPTLFRGMEQFPELLTDPRSLRQGYLEQIGLFLTEMEQGCRHQNMDYVRLRTSDNLGVALSAYLAHRLARSK